MKKKLNLLLLILSLGFVASVNAKSNVPLPSEEAVFKYIYQSVFSNSEPAPKHFHLELHPRDYGLFNNHLLFSTELWFFENQKSEESLEWFMLPSNASRGLFYTDGKSINYLHGKNRESNLKRLLKNENLQFETTDASVLASFVSTILLNRGNSGAYVVDSIKDIFRSNYTVRNENPRQISHSLVANDIEELEAKIEAKLEANKDNPALSTYSYSEFEHDQQVLEFLKKLEKDAYPSKYGGFTQNEMESLSHDELVKIAKERGHESLSGIIKPRLTNLDNNWILEFTTLSGWMHTKNTLVMNKVSFSPDYKISSVEETLSSNVYSQIPNIYY